MAKGQDLHGLRKNGEEFPVDVRLSPIDAEEGMCVLAGIVDVTDRKRLESSLRDQVVQRDRFLATLSHELRNPMAAIFTAASMLDRQAGQWTEIAQPVGVIRRQATQLARLLDDLLDVSRVTQDKIRLHRQVTDLTLLSKEAIEAVGPLLVSHRHAVHLEISDDPLWVDVDRGRILQVMENLLTNAIKYTPDNGNIWLTLNHAGKQAEIRVRDDGRGIAAPLLRSIFDMFVQSDDTLDRSDGGMGVGLTLVRSLVELHQGAIEVYSDGPDQGSEFVVRLPLVAAPAEQIDAQKIIHEPAGLRLVLVEDSDDAREMLSALLEIEGYQVQTAADGQQGLDLILASKPEVALIDIGLPVLNGYQVACGVRERYDKDQVLLIALTGYGTEEDHASVVEAGFDLHLVKPVNLTDLKSAIGCSAKRAAK
jgi:two-component system CheB/CheR fusion protein